MRTAEQIANDIDQIVLGNLKWTPTLRKSMTKEIVQCKLIKEPLGADKAIIIDVISSAFGVEDVDWVNSRCRKEEQFLWPRATFMHICREYKKLSLAQCGRQCGHRDHSTAINSLEAFYGFLTKIGFRDRFKLVVKELGIAPIEEVRDTLNQYHQDDEVRVNQTLLKVVIDVLAERGIKHSKFSRSNWKTAVVKLGDQMGLSPDEIGEVLGDSRNQVYYRLHLTTHITDEMKEVKEILSRLKQEE